LRTRGLHYDRAMDEREDAAALARAMPKVLLHEHLDGSLRVATLFELMQGRGLALPAADVDGLTRWFDAHAHAGSLAQYLEGFALTVEAMATPTALERVAFEAAEDALADGCVLAEFRIAPLLFEAHGVAGEAAIEALLTGLARSTLPAGLIVCAMRHLPPAETERAARLALRFQGCGVVAFDLAGAELGHPPAEHEGALELCRDAGLALTLHAGEADAAERVVEAVRLGARRIGHGVRLADALADPARRGLVDVVRDSDVHLEVCPTSNVHTGAAASVAAHPITALWRAGLSLSFHTDNRLMSGITHSSEARVLLQDTPLTAEDLLRMGLEAARHSFLDATVRDAASTALRAWAAHTNLATG
jgi:adenosine deaminase